MAAIAWWESVTDWTEPLIIKRLQEIQAMGWIKVSDYVSTFEHGQVGQCNERLFAVEENNEEAPDLPPIYEQKALRNKKSGKLTLKHSSDYSDGGMRPKEIFEKYGRRKKDRIPGATVGGSKSKLITRFESVDLKLLKPEKINSIAKVLGIQPKGSTNEIVAKIKAVRLDKFLVADIKQCLRLSSRYTIDNNYKRLSVQFGTNDFNKPVSIHENWNTWWEPGDEKYNEFFSVICEDEEYLFKVYHRNDGLLFSNNMEQQWEKLRNVHLCIFDSKGGTGTSKEQFKLDSAYLCSDVRSPGKLLAKEILTLTFSISSSPTNPYHNRSDKFRIEIPQNAVSRLNRLNEVWGSVKKLV